MTSFRRYGSFFLLAMALGIAPGPDILFVFAQSLAQGQAAGSLVTLGLCTGLVFHVSLAAFGIAAVLRRKPHLFKAITWCGAAYLVWLGVGAWRSAVVPMGESTAETMPYLRLYLRGIVMNVCNPKVMLFFLALMPRFVVPERGRVTAQFLLLGLTFAAATLLVFNLVAVGGGALSAFLSRWPESPAFLQCFSAIVMFGLAGWIGWMNLRKEGSPSPEVEKESKRTGVVRVCRVGKLLPNGSHTESRMRENCTYGSMRDILRAEGESRSDALAEVRAFPMGRPALLYTLQFR